MSLFKGIYYFRSYDQGWTETYWMDSDSPFSVLSIMKPLATALIKPRWAGTTIDALRISAVGPDNVALRQGGLFPIGVSGGRGQVDPQGKLGEDSPDITATAALIQVTMSDGGHLSLLWRGLDDDDVIRSNDAAAPVACEALQKAIKACSKVLSGQAVGFTKQVALADPVGVNSVQASQLITGMAEFAVQGPVGFAVKDQVYFRGVPKAALPWLKVQWMVKGVTATGIVIGYPYKYKDPIVPTGMTVQKVNRVFRGTQKPSSELTFAFQDFRTRQTGRPTSRTRGRAPGIRYRQLTRAGV